MVKLIILISGVILLIIYSLDLRNDYYFFKTGTTSIATILQTNENSYVIHISYYNENIKEEVKCSKKATRLFWKKIKEENTKAVDIIYTNKGACHFYFKYGKHPTIGSLIIHCIIFCVILFGTIMIANAKTFTFGKGENKRG
jgi:hypothetical protein